MGEEPVILLDDVLSELDAKRQDFYSTNFTDVRCLLPAVKSQIKNSLKTEKSFCWTTERWADVSSSRTGHRYHNRNGYRNFRYGRVYSVKKDKGLSYCRRKRGRVVNVSFELPKSFVVCEKNGKITVYISQLSSKTLIKRSQSPYKELMYRWYGYKKEFCVWKWENAPTAEEEFHMPHRLQAEEKQNISAKSAEKRARLQLIRR